MSHLTRQARLALEGGSVPASSPSAAASAEAERAFASLTEIVGKRLAAGKSIRRSLPQVGRLHMDRSLPFLCLYRVPGERADVGGDQLVVGEASYLIGPRASRARGRMKQLVTCIAETAARKFGAFLVLEIWTGEEVPVDVAPSFRLVEDDTEAGARVVDALQSALGKIKIAGRSAGVEVVRSKDCKHRPRPLLDKAEAGDISCSWIGVEVAPVFRGSEAGPIFPAVMRSLRIGLGRALRRSVFEFSSDFTTHAASNFLSLGRRRLVKAVWAADAQLSEIASSYDFLLELNPINTKAAWSAFRKSNFEREPRFRYRPVPIDPGLVKRHLYQIPIDGIEDPVVTTLFLDKQSELDRQLTMLTDRGTRRFLLGSQQLYGPCVPELVRQAEEILERVPSGMGSGDSGKAFTFDEFRHRAEVELAEYRKMWDGFDATVQTSDQAVSGILVSRGHLLLAPDLHTPASRAEALLQHEVGTHLVTYYNGKAQRLQQLATGLAGYDELQEGLAVLAEFLVGGLTSGRLRTLAARVIAVHALIDGATFIDVFRLLLRMGFAARVAFTISVRVFRGGGLTKDMVYLRGFQSVLDYIRKGADLKDLYVGKMALSHLPVLQELQTRKVVEPARLVPRYLGLDEAKSRLDDLARGPRLYELVSEA